MAGISSLMGETFGMKTNSLVATNYKSVFPALDKLPRFPVLLFFSLLHCHVTSELIIREGPFAEDHYMGGLWAAKLHHSSGDHKSQLTVFVLSLRQWKPWSESPVVNLLALSVNSWILRWKEKLLFHSQRPIKKQFLLCCKTKWPNTVIPLCNKSIP